MATLILLHSITRFLVLFMLVAVLALSVYGFFGRKPFGKLNDKASLYMLIFTHIQFLLGLILYFTSDLVQFTAETMKNKVLRYWAVEHVFMMLVAIALITLARVSLKRLSTDQAKHRRLMVFTAVALLLIIVAILQSGRPLFGITAAS